ncbi:hypothetical protein M9H77_18417 [Catharanthus roseus]|uniref:Uncharacterized protein n=1 Tax=Catharanthus roseus TaxID=4058 RepID=A0ACC0B7E2_CATRO|nr:hypothetical protein M9H77_18417 [Catharanthus roseus]
MKNRRKWSKNGSRRQKDSTYRRWQSNLLSAVGAEDGWERVTKDLLYTGEKRFSSKAIEETMKEGPNFKNRGLEDDRNHPKLLMVQCLNLEQSIAQTRRGTEQGEAKTEPTTDSKLTLELDFKSSRSFPNPIFPRASILKNTIQNNSETTYGIKLNSLQRLQGSPLVNCCFYEVPSTYNQVVGSNPSFKKQKAQTRSNVETNNTVTQH